MSKRIKKPKHTVTPEFVRVFNSIKVVSTTFEQAMTWLRKGEAIRRRDWLPSSAIFRAGKDVFVKFGAGTTHPTPHTWKPYAGDFLATDWERADNG